MEQAAKVVLWVRTRAFLAVAICCCWRLMTVECVGGAPTKDRFQGEEREKHPPSWRLLTRENFTSELNQHEFAFFVAKLPWCGESRILMKDIQRVVKEDPHSFPGLQLFFVHINKDRLLRKVILGASTSPSFTLYRYGIPYKYNGRRSTASIMASIQKGIRVLRSDSVLPHIESSLELASFADSTDKAVVLFDFCGWERKLRQEKQRIRTTDDIENVHSEEKLNESRSPDNGEKKNGKQVGEIGSDSGDVGGVHTPPKKTTHRPCSPPRGENNINMESSFQNAGHCDPIFDRSVDRKLMATAQKTDLERTVADTLDDVADCMGQDALYCISGNACQEGDDSTSVSKTLSPDRGPAVNEPAVNLKSTVAEDPEYRKEILQEQSLCSRTEYEIFESVYHNVSKLAADSILTPHRTRFAIVTNEEVISQAGISTQGRPWLLIYLLHDFDRRPYSFDGVGEVEDFLSDHARPLVIELEGGEGYDSATSLFNDTPSVILFIDRMSGSPEIQEKSIEALDALQALSYHYVSLADDEAENGTQTRNVQGKEKRFPEVEEKGASVCMEENKFPQMIESGGMSTLLKKGNLETGSVQLEPDLPIVFELLVEQSQLKNNNGEKDALLGNPDILFTKLAQLKLLEERVRQSLGSGADSFLLTIPVSSGQLQKQESSHPAQTLGHGDDKDSTFSEKQSYEAGEEGQLIGVSSSDSMCGDCLLDDSTDERVLCQKSLQTQTNPESSDVLANIGNDGIYVSVCLGDMIEKSCLGMKQELSAEHSGSIGSLSSTNVESSQQLLCESATNNEGKSGMLCNDAEVNHTDEEDHQQFLVDENEETNSNWDGLGFFFVDGEDQMKERLTRSKTTPALVIIDPEKQAHYVFPSNLVLNVTSLLSFVEYFLSGELKRTIFSESQLPPPRQPLRPPFVNRDFHDIHPVPRVSVDSFAKLVTGFRETDAKGNQFTFHQDGQEESEENGGNLTESAREKDVLVLFTTPWCGFCKRMELVVREVYRSFQLVKGLDIPPGGDSGSADVPQNMNDPMITNPDRCPGGECNPGEIAAWTSRMDAIKAPLLLQMDCTLNDCSGHLREILEEETYPAVVLFPARNKLSPVVYNGAATVRGIFDFLKGRDTATCPSKKHEGDTLNEKVINNRGKVSTSSEDVSCDPVKSSTSIKIGSGPGIRSQQDSATFLWHLNSKHTDVGRHAEVGVGSVLLATEKLLGASLPFENAIVLIVSAAPGDMVHGLIVNKPMAWKSVQGLDGRVDELLNSAALGYGGPVVENIRPMLILTHLQSLEEFSEVVPGVYYGFLATKGNLLEMIHTGKFAAKDFWFFLGYSSWTWHQLQIEQAQELWLIRTFSHDLVNWPPQWRS